MTAPILKSVGKNSMITSGSSISRINTSLAFGSGSENYSSVFERCLYQQVMLLHFVLPFLA